MINFVGILFIIFSFFPFLSPIKNGFDSQPFAMIFCLFFLGMYIIKNQKLDKQSIGFLLLFLVFIVFFFVDLVVFSDFDLIFRTAANYISICFLPIGFYIFFKRYGFPKRLFKATIIVYFLIALIQFFVSKRIFEFIVHVRTSLDRGVTSLAPEPTYYGVICYLFLIVLVISNDFSRKEKITYSLILITQIIFLAKSSMVILYLLFMGVGFLISSKMVSAKHLITSVVILGISTFFIFYYDLLHGTRVMSLIDMAATGGIYIFGQDASMNDRLSHVYMSFYGFYYNFGIPGLFSSFTYLLEQKKELSNGFFWWGGAGNKIMSFWGTIVYELGIFGILYVAIVFHSIAKNRAFMILAFCIPLLGAIPIANPIISFIIALGLFKLRKV